jgi:hypothetical protein
MKMATLLVSVAVALASTASLYGAEAYYSGGFPQGVPWAVFGFLAVAAFVTALGISSGVARFSSHKLSGVGLFLVGLIALSGWITVFADQLPCFLGSTGC